MNLSDELYYENHFDDLVDGYYDYLEDNDMSEDEYGFQEFINDI